MNIITNFHWHNFLYGYELPDSCRNDFDWLNDEEYETASFIKYKGIYYALDEFMQYRHEDSAETALQNHDAWQWHGYYADSFYSGVLVRLSDDGEQYQIATYIS